MATAVLVAADDLAANNPGYGSVSVSAAHARALVDRDVDALLVAAGRHRHPWAKGCANADLVALYGERGEDGETHLAVARRIFERMGAEAEVARLVARSGVVEDAGGAVGEWERLSEPEQDIAMLVGAGLTNRQVAKQLFLSPHTVNYHLRGIFRKLGINSRVELARMAHEQAPSRS